MTLTSEEAQSQSLPRGLHATAKLALRIPRVIQRPQPRPSLVFSRSAAAETVMSSVAAIVPLARSLAD